MQNYDDNDDDWKRNDDDSNIIMITIIILTSLVTKYINVTNSSKNGYDFKAA